MDALETPMKKAAHAIGVRRITTRPSNRHVRVVHAGEPVAESDRA